MEVGQEFPKYVERSANGVDHKPEPEAKPARKPKRPARRRKTSHAFSVFNAFRDHGASAGGLSATQRCVWFVIWSHVDTQTGVGRLSYQTLGEKSGLKVRQTKYVVQELLEKGFLQLVQRGSSARWASNVYRVFSAPSERISSALEGQK